jgi:hypothetical protein
MIDRSAISPRPPTVISTTHSPREGSITHGVSTVPQVAPGEGEDDGEDEGDSEGVEGEGSEGVGEGDGSEGRVSDSRGISPTHGEPADRTGKADDAGDAVTAQQTQSSATDASNAEKIAHDRLSPATTQPKG